MRVVIELANFDTGGLEKVVLDSALAFEREGTSVMIVTPGQTGQLAEVARAAGIELLRLPKDRPERAYEAALERFGPHLAMSHFSTCGYRSFARQGIPNVTFIHNIYAFLTTLQRREMLANDRFVTRYIAVSDKAARYASGAIGLPAEKIVTIPNGLNIAEHEARAVRPPSLTRADFQLREEDYVFLHPASYNLHKGHYVITEALLRLRDQRDDIKVLCLGKDAHPPHTAELRRHIEAHGLGRMMLMPGYVEDIDGAMQLADACLLPSFIEGWSIAMNEAMFHGKPLILTDTGGASEVIENNDIGILLPTEYPDLLTLDAGRLNALAHAPGAYRLAAPLAEAMIAFADDRAGWAAAGAKGRHKLYERHDFQGVVRSYERIMREVATA